MWCSFSDCNSVKRLCQHYEEDLSSAKHLASSQPNKVLIAKYEEIVSLPNITLPIVLKVSLIDIKWNLSI